MRLELSGKQGGSSRLTIQGQTISDLRAMARNVVWKKVNFEQECHVMTWESSSRRGELVTQETDTIFSTRFS